jgi:diguanylate cyclase (GGDEF)-like protein/PAS domain S-box-containing protein
LIDYKSLVENSNAGMFVFENGHIVYANEAFESILGISSVSSFGEREVTLHDLIPLEILQTLDCKKSIIVNDSVESRRLIVPCNHHDGHTIFVELFLKTALIKNKKITFGTVIDVTDSTKLQQELQLSDQRYRSLFEYNTNLIYSFDLNDQFDSMNPAVSEALGYTYDELIHINFKQFIHPDDLGYTLENYGQVKLYGKHSTYETRVIHKSGEIRHMHIINIPIIVDQKIAGVYGIAQDITELKRYVEQIEHHAFYDHLTDLPNRRELEKRTAHLIQEKQPCVMAIIDLDGFKTINDTLGHDVGDEVLKEFARRLQKITSDTKVMAARLGGDEFALLQASSGLDGLLRISRAVLNELNHPLIINDFEIYISASIGISGSYRGELTPVQLLRNADIALYSSKGKGKGKLSIYSELHDKDTTKRFTLVRDIRRAISNNQFYLEYQPKIDVRSGSITGFEALVRWSHPIWGRVSPAEFIPIAEESGFIVELGKWVLQTAFREFKSIAEQFEVSLSVNVSVIQIMNKNFIADLKQLLKSEGYPQTKLELEITESTLYNSEEMVSNFLKELKSLDIQVSLDDFGTGYSSLSFIQKYAIDTVKLDRAFIADLAENGKGAKVLSGIISLLQSLQMKVVAEGIETEEQMFYLSQYNCDEAQGFLFSKPVPVSEIAIKENNYNENRTIAYFDKGKIIER